MSWTTTFQLDYATQTASSSSTAATGVAQLQSTDTVLVFATGPGAQKNATVGSVAAIQTATAATSNTTGTNISPFGFTPVTATTTAFNWLLSDPPGPGICKTLFQTSTTSTANLITTVSATISATGASSGTSINGISITFGQAGAYAELQSLSTSKWALVGRSAAGITCT